MPARAGSSSIAARPATSAFTARHASRRHTDVVSMDTGLAKTRGGFLARVFGREKDQPVTAEWLDELEEALLRSDLSVSLVDPVMLQVRDVVADRKADTVPKVVAAGREAPVAGLEPGGRSPNAAPPPPRVVPLVGRDR